MTTYQYIAGGVFLNWQSPQRPAELAESRIIDAILTRHFPIDSHLPAERELSAQLGVTRPTLREALQRLARDGWVEIRQGRPTRVRDYWQEGNLGVLGAIGRQRDSLPGDFVGNLLEIRRLMAPAYTKLAVAGHPDEISELLCSYRSLPEHAKGYADADFHLHHRLTALSSNPIFTLILNGFSELYHDMALIYFSTPQARAHSLVFYHDLERAASNHDPYAAMQLTDRVMAESLDLWARANPTQDGST